MGGDTTLSFSLLLFLRSMPAGCEGDVNATQLLSLALLSVLAAHAQVIKPGRCPRPAVQQKFDAAWLSVNPLNRSANSCVLPGFLAHGMKSRGCSGGATPTPLEWVQPQLKEKKKQNNYISDIHFPIFL